MTNPSHLRCLTVMAATALSVAATAELAALFISEATGITPLLPAAGLALAASLINRRCGPWGALLGAALVQLLAPMRVEWLNGPGAAGWGVGLGLALAFGLQSALGAHLVRRLLGAPVALSHTSELLRFVLAGGLLPSGLVASLFVPLLALLQPVGLGEALFACLTWCLGSTLGVAIGAPLALCFIGQPRGDWRPRIVSVALPLAAITVLLSAAGAAVTQWDAHRQHHRFERDAAISADLVVTGLQGPLLALRATSGLFMADAQVSQRQMHEATRWWLQQPYSLHVIGYSAWVPKTEVAAFEARHRSEGLPDYKVFDRTGPGAISTTGDDAVLAISFNESTLPGPGPFGLNALSVAAPREAILRARASAQPVVTSGFRLTRGDDAQWAVVAYQPIFDRSGKVLRGMVFVAASMQSLVDSLLERGPSRLTACLLDVTLGSAPTRLAGPLGCETAAVTSHQQVHELPYGGRQWQLRLSAPPQPPRQLSNAWLFAMLSLGSAALLGGMLLQSSSRTSRVEQAVNERTAALMREIQERRRTEQAWRESEAHLRTIFDAAPVGIVYADLNGQVLQVNPAYCHLLGYTEDELRHFNERDLAHPDDRAAVAHQLEMLLNNQASSVRIEKRCLRRDGSSVHAQTWVALLRDGAGEPYATVRVVEDIGERMRRADAEKARDAAQSASRAKSEFISRMSHELRTPLNAILGFAQLLCLEGEHALPARQRAWAEQVQQAGWHLLRMINDTLDLSRIEAGAMRLDQVAVPVAPLIESTLALIEGAAAEQGIRLQVHVPPRLADMLGDATRAKQILTNLLSNAIKYNRRAGQVTVQAQAGASGFIDISVTDTGQGLRPEQLAQLFQPYNRLGREGGTVDGTGIGLAISHRLAELMGGSLRASSVLGQGSTFTLSMPCAGAAGGLPDPGAAAWAVTAPRGGVVHYIEDNETNVEVMRGILLQRPHIELLVSVTGQEGLTLLRQRRPDLVLLDMHLPDMNGHEFLQALKQDAALHDLPVIMLSADATVSSTDLALMSGARLYLTKPINVPELLGALDDALAQPA